MVDEDPDVLAQLRLQTASSIVLQQFTIQTGEWQGWRELRRHAAIRQPLSVPCTVPRIFGHAASAVTGGPVTLTQWPVQFSTRWIVELCTHLTLHLNGRPHSNTLDVPIILHARCQCDATHGAPPWYLYSPSREADLQERWYSPTCLHDYLPKYVTQRFYGVWACRRERDRSPLTC